MDLEKEDIKKMISRYDIKRTCQKDIMKISRGYQGAGEEAHLDLNHQTQKYTYSND